MPAPVFPPAFANDATGLNGEDLEATYLNGLFAAVKTYIDTSVADAETLGRSQTIALSLVFGG